MTPCFRGSGNCLKFPGDRISKVPEISKIWIPAQRVSRDDDRNRLASSYSEMYEIYENTKCDLNQFFPTPHRRSFLRAPVRAAPIGEASRRDLVSVVIERPRGARGIREHVVEIISENLDALDRDARPPACASFSPVAPASSARTSPSASRRGIPSTRCAHDFDPVCIRRTTHGLCTHLSRERLTANDSSRSTDCRPGQARLLLELEKSRTRERMRERAVRQGRCAFVRFIELRLAKRAHRHRHALRRAESRGQLFRELVRVHEE